jgi:hypothetical protein
MWDYQTLGAILVGIVRVPYLKDSEKAEISMGTCVDIARIVDRPCGARGSWLRACVPRGLERSVVHYADRSKLVTKIRNASPIGGDSKSKYSAVACDRVSQALLGLSGSSESEMAVVLLDVHECMP